MPPIPAAYKCDATDCQHVTTEQTNASWLIVEAFGVDVPNDIQEQVRVYPYCAELLRGILSIVNRQSSVAVFCGQQHAMTYVSSMVNTMQRAALQEVAECK